jgi:hypothetical protein
MVVHEWYLFAGITSEPINARGHRVEVSKRNGNTGDFLAGIKEDMNNMESWVLDNPGDRSLFGTYRDMRSGSREVGSPYSHSHAMRPVYLPLSHCRLSSKVSLICWKLAERNAAVLAYTTLDMVARMPRGALSDASRPMT